MSDIIKAAIIAALAIVVSVGLYIYHSPYQTCVRAQTVLFQNVYDKPVASARVACAHR